jgi:hypothetical protein
MVVAIHQPNFFPWLGFFDKINRADVFILFDDVQFPKTGGVWSNRAMFLVSGEAKWITATIDRNYHGTKNINEMKFHSTDPWRQKMFKSLENSYKKHPYFDEIITEIFPLLNNEENNIALYNVHAILHIAKKIEVDLSKIRLSSELEKLGTSNELLINLTKFVNGDTYMCGGGADGYQDEQVFKSNNVKLENQNFKHPTYPQFKRSNFTPGLSIIDALMNIGFSGTAELMRK